MEGLSLKERWLAETPKFWKKVQKIGLVLSAIGAAVVSAPVSLPAAVVTAGSYAVFGGGLLATMSQLTVDDSQVSH